MELDGQISFSDISFSFGDRLIMEHFSETIHSGEHVCIMGESGAGKSTLINSIVGLTVPTTGHISVHGIALTSSNVQGIRETISWVPQNVQLPYATVREMLQAPYVLSANKGKMLDMTCCVQLFVRLGLDESILNKRLKSISGGEKQRLLIISALMLDRKILLMDEPTSALDATNRDKLGELLREYSKTTILSVTHDDKFAASMDRVIRLEKSYENG